MILLLHRMTPVGQPFANSPAVFLYAQVQRIDQKPCIVGESFLILPSISVTLVEGKYIRRYRSRTIPPMVAVAQKCQHAGDADCLASLNSEAYVEFAFGDGAKRLKTGVLA